MECKLLTYISDIKENGKKKKRQKLALQNSSNMFKYFFKK